MTVADAFDAMTHDRPYREARSEEEAVAELKASAGTQFDPKVVEALERRLIGPSTEAKDQPSEETIIPVQEGTRLRPRIAA